MIIAGSLDCDIYSNDGPMLAMVLLQGRFNFRQLGDFALLYPKDAQHLQLSEWNKWEETVVTSDDLIVKPRSSSSKRLSATLSLIQSIPFMDPRDGLPLHLLAYPLRRLFGWVPGGLTWSKHV